MKNKMPLKFLVFSSMTLGLAACMTSQSMNTTVSQTNTNTNRMPADTGIVQAALPPVMATPDQQQNYWNDYCVGDRNSIQIPVPNYRNREVVYAAQKLAMVEPQSFYFYSGPLYAYGLKNGKILNDVPANFPAEIKETTDGRKNAHAFLTLLCGEFRDRPSLIKEKIKWVAKLYKLPDAPQEKINVKNDHLWEKMSAQSYQNYINISQRIYRMKKTFAAADETVDADFNTKGPMKLGKYEEEAPVEPYTICETKYIFDKYVVPKKAWDNVTYKKYKSDLKKFASRCTASDKEYLYDFRGDSNFKPNSPESNGMIWFSSTIANSCMRTKDGQLVLKESVKAKFANQDICSDYFKAPFAHRWTAARAGLATWLFNSRSTDNVFSESNSSVIVMPNYDKLNTAFDYRMEDGATTDKVLPEWSQNQADYWKRNDLGFNTIMKLGTKSADKGFVFERLRNAVNRHTDWYASGYDDMISGPEKVKTQAYSPFVASSFEMQASDGFTSPGMTVNSPSDGCKHWMFVFKIKRDQWYSSRSIHEGKPVDFNHNWFDETSLGTNNLADHERALDRLGTALEGELDSILYLNNINDGGGVQKDCGINFNKQGVPQSTDTTGAVGLNK